MEYQRSYPSPAGILFSLLVLVVMGAITVSGLWAVGNTVSDSVGHIVSIVNTETVERNHTERTRIEWDGRVEIAEINADATKKTDFTFLLFWLARFGVWSGSITMLGAGAWWIYEKVTHEPPTTTVD